MDGIELKENDIAALAFSKAVEVRKELGVGLLESCYEACLEIELKRAGLKVERQKVLPVYYKGQRVEIGYRADMVLEDKVILELKAVSEINDAHKAQLLNYLKLTKMKLGLILNFNAQYMGKGVARLINGHLD